MCARATSLVVGAVPSCKATLKTLNMAGGPIIVEISDKIEDLASKYILTASCQPMWLLHAGLGKTVCAILHRGPSYFEVDIDVGSSKSAASVVGLVQGALKGLVIDMAITMEGHTKVMLLYCTVAHSS